MQHYRRKPIESVPLSAPGALLGTAAKTVSALRRELLPFAHRDQVLPSISSLIPTAIPPGADPASPEIGTQGGQIQDAASLVPGAAGILDEEMAAGVLAARDARATATKNSPVSGDKRALGNQPLLRDVHDFIDALADMLPRLQDTFGDAPMAAHSTMAKTENGELSILRASQPVSPGQTAKISFKVHNDDARPARFVAHCTHLLHSSGHRIGDNHIYFAPREIDLAPDQTSEVCLNMPFP